MKENDLRVAEKFKEHLSEKVKISEVRIFGSRGRGDATAESDLDVLVILEHLDRSTERYISECAWEIGFQEDIVIVPFAVTRDAVENSPLKESVFMKTALREGVAI